jgi:hypothetical protein
MLHFAYQFLTVTIEDAARRSRAYTPISSHRERHDLYVERDMISDSSAYMPISSHSIYADILRYLIYADILRYLIYADILRYLIYADILRYLIYADILT